VKSSKPSQLFIEVVTVELSRLKLGTSHTTKVDKMKVHLDPVSGLLRNELLHSHDQSHSSVTPTGCDRERKRTSFIIEATFSAVRLKTYPSIEFLVYVAISQTPPGVIQ
jgi:hypothetical protein